MKKEYERYVDSGVCWIGLIPESWAISKIKYQADINKNTLAENTDPDYEIQYIDIGNVNSEGKVNELQKYKFENAPSRARRVVNKHDILISTVRTYLKAITSIDEIPKNVICSTGFAVLSPKDTINPLYLAYLVRSEVYIDEIVSRSTGVSYPAINASEIAALECILPDLKTQFKIGKYLEKKTNEIDRLIQTKNRLITLLEEKLLANITNAVTKGLDSDVKMKHSGAEWIGKIPEHWKMRKIKYLVKRESRPVFNDYDVITAFRDGEVTLRKNRREEGFTFSLKEIGYQGINKGDLVVHQMDAFAGAIGISDSNGKASPVYTVCSAIDESITHLPYISQVIRYMARSGYIQSLAKGIRERSTDFRWSDMGNIMIMLPPIEEQTCIADFCNKESEKILKHISDIRISIKKLKEYRQSLIYEAVTGKIDVRDIEIDS